MQARQGFITAPRQALIIVALLALLASAAIGYVIRYATAPSAPGATAQHVTTGVSSSSLGQSSDATLPDGNAPVHLDRRSPRLLARATAAR